MKKIITIFAVFVVILASGCATQQPRNQQNQQYYPPNQQQTQNTPAPTTYSMKESESKSSEPGIKCTLRLKGEVVATVTRKSKAECDSWQEGEARSRGWIR